jgi:hypothetical protein
VAVRVAGSGSFQWFAALAEWTENTAPTIRSALIPKLFTKPILIGCRKLHPMTEFPLFGIACLIF